MTIRPMAALAATAAVLILVTHACRSGASASGLWQPMTDPAVAPSPDLRGTPGAASALSENDQSRILRTLVQEHHRPPGGKASWIDPRYLAHLRGPADDTVGADFDWADVLKADAHHDRICVLNGHMEARGACRGMPGGIVRFSRPYLTGKDSAVVYAQWRPIPDSTGTPLPVEYEAQVQFHKRVDTWWLINESRVPLADSAIAITEVSVVDATSATPRAGQTVIVRGNRIIAVGPHASTSIPPDARRIDGRGKYVIPGLWDMHVHLSIIGGRTLLGLYVANGVTGVRDMAGGWDTLSTWRRQVIAGSLVGPRIVASGPYLEGGDVPIPHILTRTPEEGAAGVDSLVKLGVDFIKVHGQLRPETFYGIARRAREKRIAFGGHVSNALGAANASDSGQKSIEHMLGIPAPCTEAESLQLRPRHPIQQALGRCRSTDLAPLYEKLKRNGTWVTPTAVAMVEIAGWPTQGVPGDSVAHLLPAAMKAYVRQIFPMPDSFPPGAEAVGRAMLGKRLQQVATMHRAGVEVMTGTDAPLRNSPPGFGLHEEMLLLTRGGLTPFEALRAATLGPARFLGALDSLGTVERGRVADLVLLDANPLADIRNTRRIAAVFNNGRYINASERRRLLNAAADK